MIKRVPKGWVAPEISFILNEEAERQTVTALETYEEQLEVWQRAYDELYDKTETYRADTEARWVRVMKNIKEMETAHAAEVKAAKKKARSPGWGVFAGFGHEGDAVIGVGLVWKVF